MKMRFPAALLLLTATLAMGHPPSAETCKPKAQTAAEELRQYVIDGNIEMVNAALDKGAQVDSRDEGGRTLLMWASMGATKEISELLIRKGADVNAKDNGEMTPLSCAAWSGDSAIAEILIKGGANVNGDRGLRAPLCEAIAQHNLKTAEVLLDKGADPNLKLPGDGTPLALAAKAGDVELIELLLKHKARINDLHGAALNWAIMYGRTDAAEVLFKNGAEVDIKDEGNATPLMRAVVRGDRRMISLLMKHGANVDAKDIDGMTPLGFAHELGRKEIVELLKSNGAKDAGKRIGTKWSEAPSFKTPPTR